MNKAYDNKLIATLGLVLVVAVIWMASSDVPKSLQDKSVDADSRLVATMYKTPTCGCCRVYGQYLKREDIDVTVVDVEDITPIKEQYGIPPSLVSCHTTIIGGYVVEGHIPITIIERLLAENPDIKGIALPGMPSGSPGMPGLKTAEWTIHSLNNDDTTTEFMKY